MRLELQTSLFKIILFSVLTGFTMSGCISGAISKPDDSRIKHRHKGVPKKLGRMDFWQGLEEYKGYRYEYWYDFFMNKQRDRFLRFIKNGEKYRSYIEGVLEEYGLPQELFFVGLIESGYYLKNRSHAGASGPWQFMKYTGKKYGLQVNQHIDERFNLYKATHAAAKYFLNLYNIFDQWPLALCAYNAGEYGIMRAIKRGNSRNLNVLAKRGYIRRETANYIPKILAARDVAKALGVLKETKDHGVYPLALKRTVHVDHLSQALDIEVETLKTYNPDIKHGRIPASTRRPFILYLPTKIDEARLVSLSSEKERRKAKGASKYLNYRIRRGDSLYRIARRYKAEVSEIREINNLKTSRVLVGQVLKIPQ